MKRILLSFFTIFIFTCTSIAQNESGKWGVGIHAGAGQYNGELENQFFKFSGKNYNGVAGVSVYKFLNNHFDLGLDLTLGDIKFEQTKEEGGEKFDYNMGVANLHLTYNFFKYEDVTFRPFISAGAAFMRFESFGRNENNLALPSASVGVNYKLNDRVNIKYKSTLFMSNYDELDNSKGGGNDMYLHNTLGIATAIVSSKDADNDGIIDKRDKCPGTPPGTKVNLEGCAVDRDGDGVLNGQDNCPDVAGVIGLNGCPDRDNDGVADGDDACPDIAGSAELGGCPDSDNDGLADNVDKCPNEAGAPGSDGCPVEEDVYATGIFEYEKLPLQNGTLVVFDENGEPVDTIRTDENGVFKYKVLDPDMNYSIKPILIDGKMDEVAIYLVDENMEKTHDTRKTGEDMFVFTKKPSVVDDKGKPSDTKPVDTKVTDATIPAELLSNIIFTTSSSSVNIKYYDQLNRLANLLKKSERNIEVHGYTDITGPMDFNIRLSQVRADRVKEYLIKKGVKAELITSKGHGTDSPVGSNETIEGRKLNRRVELKLK